MTGKKTNGLIVVGLLALALGAPPAASAETACAADVGQDVAVARSGNIPGLGRVTGSLGWDRRAQLSLATADFEAIRTMLPTGEFEISIAAAGEPTLVIRAGGADGLVVTRGASVVRGTSDLEALRALTSGHAATAFREHVGGYERRLISMDPSARADDAHAYGFVVTSAFVASLAGDPTAMARARDLIMRRLRGRVRAAAFQIKDCVSDYERALLQNDSNRTHCLDAANSRDAWYQRAGERLLCEAEFVASTLSSEGQFISCSALLPLAQG
jgi:hypothetical protein